MTLESASYIDDLNQSYPEGTAKKSKGDDHLRLIKDVLKNTFPNITGAVTATQDDVNRITSAGSVNHPLEAGTKTIFYQAAAPTGWTQDTTAAINGAALRGVTGSGGGSGGSNDISGISTQGHALTVSEMPSHDHGGGGNTGSTDPGGTVDAHGSDASSANLGDVVPSTNDSVDNTVNVNGENHSHSYNIPSEGGDNAHSHNIDPKTVDVIICSKD